MKTNDLNDLILFYNKTYEQNFLSKIIENCQDIIQKQSVYFYLKNKKKSSIISFEDIKSTACEGVIVAVSKFDPNINSDFKKYAKIWIKSKIKKYIFDNISSLKISGRKGRYYFSNYFNSSVQNDFEKELVKNTIHSSASIDPSFEEERFLTSSKDVSFLYDQKVAQSHFKNEIFDFGQKLSVFEKDIFFDRILSENKKKLSFFAKKYDCSEQNVFAKELGLLKKFQKRILSSDKKDLFHTLIEE